MAPTAKKTTAKKTASRKTAVKKTAVKGAAKKPSAAKTQCDVLPDEQALRARIDVVGLLDRLGRTAKGELEMSATEIRSAELLLKKVLPDLKTSDARMLIASPRFVISADPMTVDVHDWADKFGAFEDAPSESQTNE